MWPFKPKTRPTCTQKIFDINPYYFFDDHRRPGIIQDFSQVKKAAIPEGEYSALRFATDKKYHSECMKKLETFLTDQGNQSLLRKWIVDIWDPTGLLRPSEQPSQYDIDEMLGLPRAPLKPDPPRLHSTERDGFKLLKAYIQVLKLWNYPFDLKAAHDASGGLTMAILNGDHAFSPTDVRAIDGTPSEFTVYLRNAIWQFHWRAPIIEKQQAPGLGY